MPHNMALYRILVKAGASEAEAEEAATIDVSNLATKSDLREAIAELKASLLMWIIMLLVAQTGLLLTLLRWTRP